MATQPNVAVIVLDTTRFDDGTDPRVTPELESLATSGTRASRAFATAPWTLPSHASILTGTHTSKHGAYAEHERVDGSLPMLAECFRDAGYETVCVSNNTWLSAESGFDRGFDTFQQMWQAVQSENALSELVDVIEESRIRAVARELFEGNPLVNVANVLYRYLVRNRTDDGAARSTAWVDNWLRRRESDDPFFLFVNYLEPHLEYRPPRRLAEQYLPEDVTYEAAMAIPQEPWEYLAGNVALSDSDLRALRALYRAEIRYVDEQLGVLERTLRDVGAFEDTVLVVTSDHGENIGHHGLMDHQYCLYDTLVHVPLVLNGGGFSDGADVSSLVSLVDLAPTLLDEAGIDAAESRDQFMGVSFHPDTDTDPREFVISEYAAPMPSMDALERNVDDLPETVSRYDRSLRAIRTPEYKLVRGSDGTHELYDLNSDGDETTNIAADRPRLVDDLGSTLDEWLASFEHASTTESVSISRTRKDQLEELGYLQ